MTLPHSDPGRRALTNELCKTLALIFLWRPNELNYTKILDGANIYVGKFIIDIRATSSEWMDDEEGEQGQEDKEDKSFREEFSLSFLLCRHAA